VSEQSNNANEAAIVAEDLAVGYDGVPIMEGLNFAIKPAEVFFVIGGSGCGKSTLLRHLIGLQQPITGDVRILGESFVKASAQRRREFLKSFGVLYQSSALWSSLTLAENIMLPLEEYTDLNRREREQLARLKLAQVGLNGYHDYYPAEISGGMKKRAGFARALALDPRIVFFDEPSAGLDPITSRELDELIVHIRDTHGTTCVIVSHELASIFSIGDRVLMLEKNARTAIAEGPPLELAKTSRDSRVLDFMHRGDKVT
jgi:phospholipid/cholesterol/gamma-HCH transport system ATP-binding protein